MKNFYFFGLSGVCAVSMFFAATAIGADCQSLNGKKLSIDANGYQGSMSISLISGSFNTTIKFNGFPVDNVVGTCQGPRSSSCLYKNKPRRFSAGL
ncbi:hypothetical protein VU07_01575 [Desulfobulbus sp. F4]|nr:hypothetical protein [Desulfobulbus sp. F4]